MQVEIFAFTNDGRVRPHNEDNFDFVASQWSPKNRNVDVLHKGVLLIVADGMGGTNAGEVASKIAVDTIKEKFNNITIVPKTESEKKQLIQSLILDAHKAIVRHGKIHVESAGMGTTAVVAWLVDNIAVIGWCGDSRCYVYRKGEKFYPITNDHSMVWEEVMKNNMSAEQARLHENSNIILQSLGDASQPPKPDVIIYPLQQNDRLLLCSDGLNSMLSDKEIEYLVSNYQIDNAKLCRELINEANKAGGHDNITVVSADVKQGLNKAQKVFNIETKKHKMSNLSIVLLSILSIGGLAAAIYFFNNPQTSTPIIRKTQIDSLKVTDVTVTFSTDTNNKNSQLNGGVKKPENDAKKDNKKEGQSNVNTQVEIQKIKSLITYKNDQYGKYSTIKHKDIESIRSNTYEKIITQIRKLGYDILDNGDIKILGTPQIIENNIITQLKKEIDNAKTNMDAIIELTK